MYGELIMPNLHQDQSKRSIHTGTNYLPSNKESAEMSWQHRGLSFETKIRHLSGFSFKPIYTK